MYRRHQAAAGPAQVGCGELQDSAGGQEVPLCPDSVQVCVPDYLPALRREGEALVTQGRAALDQGLLWTVYREPWLLSPGMAVLSVCCVQGHSLNVIKT